MELVDSNLHARSIIAAWQDPDNQGASAFVVGVFEPVRVCRKTSLGRRNLVAAKAGTR